MSAGRLRGAWPLDAVPGRQAGLRGDRRRLPGLHRRRAGWSSHNAAFDVGFLNAELGRLGHPPLDPDRVVDTLALARRKHPGAPDSLDALCQRYGIDNSRRTKHGALLDAEILAEVYVELIGGRQADLGLVRRPRARSGRGAAPTASAATLRPPVPLPPRLTDAELRRPRRLRRDARRRARSGATMSASRRSQGVRLNAS